MGNEEHISLLQLLETVRDSLQESFYECVWVRAEISELKQNRSGHCYLTLVEKDRDSDLLLAKVPAIVWAATYRTLKPYFFSATGSDLAVGMNVLVKVQVQYSEMYGLSLIIYDIDPSFTVGGLELARKKTIERLKADGMFDMNSTLELPVLPRRLAVITSETAAGYRDFMRQLHENEYGFSFSTELFPAVMQGTDAPASIIGALDAVLERAGDFDAVLVLRGGGGAMDLVCFDDYDLAVNVAQFPLPVLTGIGHDHDYHVIDMVANISVKTPTALADFIVDMFAQEGYRVDSIAQRLHLALKGKFSREEALVDNRVTAMRQAVQVKCLKESGRLDLYESRISAANPEAVLSKGYAIAMKDGRRVDSIRSLENGDVVKVMLKDGTFEAQIRKLF
ncbi:MAG: exodeoxyribonuclease VII large subunit [Bacteroidales bacterium]|nr:exodeoxyribonuclease VII large subunit [Candidatus Cacconaster equi]